MKKEMKTSKNILVIATARIIGGVEKTFMNAMPLLRQRGFNIIFCFTEHGPVVSTYQKLGFKCVKIVNKGFGVINEIKSIIQTYKINLVHNNRLFLEAALAANSCKTSHLLHLHGKAEYSFPRWRPEYLKKRILHMCSLSDFAIGCSRFVTNQLNGFISPSKLKCIYDGVPIRKNIVHKQSNNGSETTVGMIAHFYPLKRHKDFILAAKCVLDHGLDTNFFIAGHCWGTHEQELYFERLKKMIEDLGLSHRFKLYKGLKDITHLYDEMDIFVLPSIGEGLSVALLEAMQFAIPVIVTKSGGPAEIIKQGENGFLVGEKKPKEIAQTIIKLSEDEKLAKTVGARAREIVKQHFNVHRFASELAAVYNKLM